MKKIRKNILKPTKALLLLAIFAPIFPTLAGHGEGGEIKDQRLLESSTSRNGKIQFLAENQKRSFFSKFRPSSTAPLSEPLEAFEEVPPQSLAENQKKTFFFKFGPCSSAGLPKAIEASDVPKFPLTENKKRPFFSNLQDHPTPPLLEKQQVISLLMEHDDFILKRILGYCHLEKTSLASINKRMRELATTTPGVWDLRKEFKDIKSCNHYMSKVPKWVRTKALKNLKIGAGKSNPKALKDFILSLKDTTIHTLDLSWNGFRNEDFNVLSKYLKDTHIHTLRLGGKDFEIEGLKVLSPYLKNTKNYNINLSGNYFGSNGIQALLPYLKDIQVHILDLSANDIESEGIKVLAPHLKDINIHILNLSRNRIGKEGVELLLYHLKDTKIHSLNLATNQLKSDSVPRLIQHLKDTNLHTLNLGHNDFTAADKQGLAEAFKSTKIQMLFLDDEGIPEVIREELKSSYRNINKNIEFVKY